MAAIDRYKPAVTKNILVFLAGIVWTLVGIMLICMAFSWLSGVPRPVAHLYEVAGLFSALLIHHFGFLKIAGKNLDRIRAMPGKQCLFAFIPWKSYLIIAVMVTMGAMLRHSAIPRQYLAVLYFSIGLALVLSSVRYLRTFFQHAQRYK
jgi:ABC-type nickel/cobalt efflux system permease component RcnA